MQLTQHSIGDAERAAPVAVVPAYKQLLLATQHGRDRGQCNVVTHYDPVTKEIVFCNGPVYPGSTGYRYQVCQGHLYSPTILLSHGSPTGEGDYTRHCAKCKDLVDLELFQGFSGICTQHSEGRNRCGHAPCIPENHVPIDGLVTRPTYDLSTIVVYETSPAMKLALKQCDVEACLAEPSGTLGICLFHSKVRTHPSLSKGDCILWHGARVHTLTYDRTALTNHNPKLDLSCRRCFEMPTGLGVVFAQTAMHW